MISVKYNVKKKTKSLLNYVEVKIKKSKNKKEQINKKW